MSHRDRPGIRAAVGRAQGRRSARPGAWALAVAVATVLPGGGALAAQPPAFDSTGLGVGPYASMRTLLEKTIFKVDVLVLRIRVDTASERHIAELVGAGAGGRSRDLADSVARVALASHDAMVEMRFVREVSAEQFLDGIDDNMRRAVEAGLLPEEAYREVMAGLPASFAFLDERRVRVGDVIRYRIRGDTLRTVYIGYDGTLLLEQVDAGPERRMSVLGSFLGPRSEFLRGLVRSLPAVGG